MALTVGELVAVLRMDNKQFEDALKNATADVAKSAQEMRAMGKSLTDNVTQPLMNAGRHFLDYAVKLDETSTKLNNLSAATGLSKNRLQELDYISSELGVNFNVVTQSALGLEAKLGKLSETDVATFDRLGVSITGADGKLRSMDSIFPELITSLGSVKNETERNVLASTLFGASFKELVPIMQLTTEEQKRMAAEAPKIGEGAADGAKKFADAMKRVNEITADTVNAVMGVFLALPAPIQGVVLALGAIVALAGPMMQVVAAIKLLKGVQLQAAGAAVVAKVAFIQSWLAAAGPLVPLIAAIAAVGLAVYGVIRYWQPIKAFFAGLWGSIKELFTSFVNWAYNLFIKYSIPGLIIRTFSALPQFISSIWDKVYQATVGRLGAAFDWIKKKIEDVIGFFKNLYDKVVGHSYIPDMVRGVGDSMNQLQMRMVKPAEGAVGMTAQSFESLSDIPKAMLSSQNILSAGPNAAIQMQGSEADRMRSYTYRRPAAAAAVGVEESGKKGSSSGNARIVALLTEQLACLRQMVPRRVTS